MKIAIIGAGKLGLRITDILMGGDHDITLIDTNETLMARLSNTLDVVTVLGDGKEVSLLKDVGIESFDYAIVTTNDDEKNIVISAIAKQIGCANVVARIRDPEHMKQYDFLMQTFGIDEIVNPDRSIAEEISKYLVEKYSIQEGLTHAGKIGFMEIDATRMSNVLGLTVYHANKVIDGKKVKIAAVSRNGKLYIPSADDERVVEEDDEIYLVGERDAIDAAADKLIDKERRTKVQRVMIAGGGKSGYYLARLLEDFGASVKIIEMDKARCQYLSTHLSNVLILNGDATDNDLLEEEDISSMDAFVSTTGFDEENLLLALRAKREGVEDVIAKISRENFGDLVKEMGVDMVLNPVDISASYILRRIKESRVISSQMIKGQGELVYIAVGHDMKLQGETLRSLSLPDGVSIVAVQRGRDVFFPEGSTRIEAGDRIAVLGLLSESYDIEKLLKVRKGLFG
ncbi:MAG: Trk system potassium transporter TrkA [Clostridiales Family XIII bacterium]|jgi:trk system potassium uptake protein TrkA|nr:Trk system potassium transporter TrkA [Clostridiales Family XIII bacterium]